MGKAKNQPPLYYTKGKSLVFRSLPVEIKNKVKAKGPQKLSAEKESILRAQQAIIMGPMYDPQNGLSKTFI